MYEGHAVQVINDGSLGRKSQAHVAGGAYNSQTTSFMAIAITEYIQHTSQLQRKEAMCQVAKEQKPNSLIRLFAEEGQVMRYLSVQAHNTYIAYKDSASKADSICMRYERSAV